MPQLFRLPFHLLSFVERALGAAERRLAGHREEGQATAEYALVLVAAVAIAGLLVTWARRTNVLDTVMDGVFNSLLQRDAGR